jgi:hypothetical protein
LDETRAALGILILSGGAFGDMGLPIVEPVALSAVLSDVVLMVETDIEPDR